MKKLKIVMLSRHGCMRVMKIALPLIEMGHEVHLIVNKITQGSEHFRTVSVYQDMDQLYSAINLHKDADIFHGHNEPSWFVTAVKDSLDKPVILDIHDSHVLRRTEEECSKDPGIFRIAVDERNNFQLADGLVYVSKSMQEQVAKEFSLKQPSAMIPSAVPMRFYRIDFQRWWGGLVYEGRIDIPGEVERVWDFFQYANYLDAAKKLEELGIDFHIYTPRQNEKVRKEYGKACYLHDPQEFGRLIKHLGGHDWGLVGNLNKHQEWDNALPNKLFEYMAACLPVVAINAKESAEFIKEHKIGIEVESFEELRDRWKEHRECRKNLIKCRMRFTMENYIGDLVKLYEQFV